MLGLLSVPYTAIPQVEVIEPATQGGIASYATITTDSYLSQALQGMMQNAAGYVGWSLSQWVQAFTAQAQQRCAAYPASCVGDGEDPESLGEKYGNIAYQLMSTVVAPVNTPVTAPVQTPVTVTAVPTPTNTNQQTQQITQTSGTNEPPVVSNPNNVNQSTIAQTGGTPVAQIPVTPTPIPIPAPVSNNPASVAMQSVASGICVDAGNGTYEDTGNGSYCGASINLQTGSVIGGVASGVCILNAGGAWVDSGNGTPCTPSVPTTSNITTGTSITAPATDIISELENYSFSLFGVTLTGMEAVLGIAAIGVVAYAMSGKKGR